MYLSTFPFDTMYPSSDIHMYMHMYMYPCMHMCIYNMYTSKNACCSIQLSVTITKS